MKGNFVHTIIKSMLCLAILIALIGTANAQSPPTNPVGTWQCQEGGVGPIIFLVSFNQGGTLTASDSDRYTSDYYGTWEKTGLNTFVSTDKTFNIKNNCLVETYTENTMPDNDTINATAIINWCGETIVPPPLICTRMQINPM